MESCWALGNSRNRRPYVSRISTTSDFQSARAADPLRAGETLAETSILQGFSCSFLLPSICLSITATVRSDSFTVDFFPMKFDFASLSPTKNLRGCSSICQPEAEFFLFFFLFPFLFIEPTRVKLLWEIARVYASVFQRRCAVITRDFQRCFSFLSFFFFSMARVELFSSNVANRNSRRSPTGRIKIFNVISPRFWQELFRADYRNVSNQDF